MTYLLKDPDAVLDYSVDWGTEYLAEDQIATSEWTVTPAEAGGVAVTASDHSMAVTTVTVAGGIAGRVYRLINQVVLGSGRTDARSVMLRVEKR